MVCVSVLRQGHDADRQSETDCTVRRKGESSPPPLSGQALTVCAALRRQDDRTPFNLGVQLEPFNRGVQLQTCSDVVKERKDPQDSKAYIRG